MLQAVFGLLKFVGLFPVDILLDTLLFSTVRIINAHIANGLATTILHGGDKDLIASTPHHHEHEGHHHHSHENSDWHRFTDYINHHGQYLAPAMGIIAIDLLTAPIKGGQLLDVVHHLPVIGQIHEYIEPYFGVPFLDATFGVYEMVHTAIHLAESFMPYYNMLVLGRSFEEEMEEIQEDFIAGISIAFTPVRILMEWLYIDELVQWVYEDATQDTLYSEANTELVHAHLNTDMLAAFDH